MTTAAWVAARQQEVLPVPYFHNVFTLPHELNALILYTEHNQRVLLDLLFDSAAQTLLEFGKNELGGKVGFTLVLHTWDQRLRPHFHLHCPIASGALSEDGSRWIAGGSQYLFAVRALSKVYRGKYLDGLTRLLAQGDLDLPSQLRRLSNADSRRRWLRRLWKKSWAVYSKAPFAGPRKLMDYLGRYTHKVAISNHRLVACQNGEVTFRYRDRADGDRVKHETLPAEEFLDRFLKHILPDEFRRVRHYGLLSNRDKHKRLARCRELLGYRGSRQPDDVPTNSAEWMLELLGVDIYCCPRCNEPLRCEQLPAVGGEVDSSEAPAPFPEFEAWDTS
jgi:hypothetical protein